MTVKQRASICAMKYGVYAMAYMAAGDAENAKRFMDAAKSMAAIVEDAGSGGDRVEYVVMVAESTLETLEMLGVLSQ